MKKIMIALAVVALAAVGQAASINWSVANNAFAKSSLDTVNTTRTANYTVMLFAESNRADVMSILGAGTTDGLSALALVDATKTKATGKAGGAIANVSDGSQSVFAVIFDTYSSDMTLADAKNYIASSAVTQNSYSGTDAATSLDYTSAQFAGSSWTEIASSSSGDAPEPTSGLLLLVGAAALALRRRKA